MNQVIVYRNAESGAVVTLHTDAYGAHHIMANVGTSPEPTGDREWAESLANGLALKLGATRYEAPAPATCNCQPHPIFGHEDGCRYAGMGRTPAQMASPLPPAERYASGLARGTSVTALSPELLAKLREATLNPTATDALLRGPANQHGRATRTQLVALARRGYLALDNAVRPTCGTLTDLGRRTADA
jgi:hypothetical protein